MNLSTNANTLWMSIFVEELARSGLEAACIAPGSRSTPLTLAFADQGAVRIYRHLDERSAGFFALGLAMASGRPVALVCTSGTAAANFHPAIIEAYYSHVPLLILTADRPPELRESGANQTIDQIKMYGDHVRWSVEAPVPQSDAPEIVIRHLRTLAARAYAMADGLAKGPVHLNFPFRKPLEPRASSIELPSRSEGMTNNVPEPYSIFSRGHLTSSPDQVETLAKAIIQKTRGLIICGPGCPAGDFPLAVTSLARRSGYPILADSLSNVRHGEHFDERLILGGYHWWLPSFSKSEANPEIIIRFGAVPTSSALAAYLEETAPDMQIHIREDGEWADDLHLTRHYIQADPEHLCAALEATLAARGHSPNPVWSDRWASVEADTWERLDTLCPELDHFDGAAVRQVLAALPEDTTLFAGNSLPVRHIDTFDLPSRRRLTIFGNRGASGIDGNVSTALGVAAAGRRHVVAILGDITFYHDLNGLLAVGQHKLRNVTFIVVNNDGGGIFHRLPIAQLDPPFTDLFLTPHGLTFSHAAALYGLRYAQAANVRELDLALRKALEDPDGPQLIEINTNSVTDYQQMRALSAAVVARSEATGS